MHREPYAVVNRGLSIELFSQFQAPYKPAEQTFGKSLAAVRDPRVGARAMEISISSFSKTMACARNSD